MFPYLIILKESPWYIYSPSEDDAIKTSQIYGDKTVGVVSSVNREPLELNQIQRKFQLRPDKQELLPVALKTDIDAEEIAAGNEEIKTILEQAIEESEEE